jgi:hypothetical protein
MTSAWCAVGVASQPQPCTVGAVLYGNVEHGNVERVQQTMLTELYATTTLGSPSLEEDLGVWVLDDNYRRVRGSLGKTPMQRRAELFDQTPLWDEVAKAFDPVEEITAVDRLTLRRHAFTANKQTKK